MLIHREVTFRKKQAKKPLKLDASRAFVKTMRFFENWFCEEILTKRPIIVSYDLFLLVVSHFFRQSERCKYRLHLFAFGDTISLIVAEVI